MDDLRKPFFVVALALVAVAFLVEIGSAGVLRTVPRPPSSGQIGQLDLGDSRQRDALTNLTDAQRQSVVRAAGQTDAPPGLGIPYLALLDGLLLFTLVLMGLGLLVPERIQGRVQGVATLLVSLLTIFAAIAMILAAIALLVVMLSLLLSVPFGTLIYLGLYGSFERAGARAALALVMTLKLGFCAFLVLAQQQFLRNVGLVLIVLSSLVATLVITCLHGFVPGILVSITDAIAAIVVAVIAVIWAVVLLVGSLVSIVKAIQPRI